MPCEREDETRQNPVPPDSHRLSPISARRFCQNTALSFALRLTHAPYNAPYAVKHAVRRVVKDLGPILQVALLCHHDGRGRRVVADVKFHTLCAASNWKTGSGRCGLSGNLRTSTSILLSYSLFYVVLHRRTTGYLMVSFFSGGPWAMSHPLSAKALLVDGQHSVRPVNTRICWAYHVSSGIS